MEKGILYIVSIPIGNDDDITLRALKTLKKVNLIVAEELKIIRKLFSTHKFKNEFYILNEHNELKDVSEIRSYLENGENLALISDCGTPVFADPGTHVIKECRRKGIEVKIVPGASSLMCALTGCGFDIKKFYFAGFLSKNAEERKKELNELNLRFSEPVVIMETPYRLKAILEDINKEIPERNLSFIYKCTQKEETIINGVASKVLKYVTDHDLKGEFMLVLDKREQIVHQKTDMPKKKKQKRKRF